jgi:hypothetical protein
MPEPGMVQVQGILPKDLCMIPARVALALQADGWWLRSDIIWSKPNPMPESVTDRPTNAHEHIFLLAKSQKYFYDADAVREKADGDSHSKGKKLSPPIESAGVGHKDWHKYTPELVSNRNLRNVWTIPTHPYPDAHFATFPPALVKRCVLAGTSHKACEVCGAAWERVVEKEYQSKIELTGNEDGRHTLGRNRNVTRMGDGVSTNTLGFRPTCSCDQKGAGKCLILDPFMGSGTVAQVAQELGRDWIGIDLNPKYKDMAMKRIQGATIGLPLA